MTISRGIEPATLDYYFSASLIELSNAVWSCVFILMQSDHVSAHQCSRNTCKHKCNLIMCFLINAVWSLANTYAAWSFVCTSMQCIHVPPHQCCLITCKHQCSLFMCLHINAVWSCANVNAVWTSEQCLLNNAVWSCVCTVMLSDHARPRTYSCDGQADHMSAHQYSPIMYV